MYIWLCMGSTKFKSYLLQMVMGIQRPWVNCPSYPSGNDCYSDHGSYRPDLVHVQMESSMARDMCDPWKKLV